MTRQEFVSAQVKRLVAEGMDHMIAQLIAEITWNFTKWQYE